MKGGTALYRVFGEGFLEEVMVKLRMKNKKAPATRRLEGKVSGKRKDISKCVETKEDTGVLKEDQSG